MRKFIPLTTVLLLLQFGALAQKHPGSVQGTLQDSTTATGLHDATVSIIKAKDSSLISFTLTNNSGYFEINNLDTSTYVLMVSYQGFETLKKPFSVSAQDPSVILGQVYLNRDFKTLDGVVVTDRAPVRVKGDTLAFNADAFKTNKPNATVEDLLKKLPGVEVDKDGAVKAQGEQVQKVYVDGKEFFGNDPKLATKNLSADMIAEVEVYDDMSDQAKFNKIDDGSRMKAINLKLKKDKKRGMFGQVGAGYGTDERYSLSARTNFFKGATQIGVFANANNTNRLGFSSTDMLGLSSMGGNGFKGGTTGNIGGSTNGIVSSAAAGVNYNDTWNSHFDISSNYNYNQTGTENERRSYRQNLSEVLPTNEDRTVLSKNENAVHRSNVRLTYKIDDRNSIIFTPNISFQNSEYRSLDSSSTFLRRDGAMPKINDNYTSVQNKGNGVNWNNNLTYRRSFKKVGRTFSLNLANNYSTNKSIGFSNSLSNDYDWQTSGLIRQRIQDQQNMRENNNANYNVNASYTEPISRDKIWEVNYGYSRNNSESDRRTYDIDAGSGKYEVLNISQSNHFKNTNESNRLGTNLRIVKKKYNYQLGVSAQQTTLASNDVSKDSVTRQRYLNFFPTASFNYQFARSKSLRFNYRGSTNQPSAYQLQPVIDSSNPRYIRAGNPNLNQEIRNNFTLNYNFFNSTKLRNMFANVNVGNVYNRIVNSTRIIDSFGTQFIQPVNINGVYNANGNFNLGFPIKALKGGNFNTTSRISYNRDATLVDNRKNYIKNLTLGQDVRLNYGYKQKLDVTAAAGISYTSARYTINNAQDNSFLTHQYSLDASYIFPKGFVLYNDLDFSAYSGRSDGFNQSFTMWNVAIGKQLMKNKRGELKASVFDVLNQNRSLVRNVGENYIEDVETNVLKRFFMLSFTYNINRMGGKAMPGSSGNSGGNRTIIMH